MSATVRGATVLVGAAVALSLAGCVPEPAASPTASPTASRPAVTSSSPSETTPSAAATPDATGFAVPTDCEAAYSEGMLAVLQSQVPPLNDPGVTLFSSQNATALELLNSGIPTLRCSWGAPSEFGLATNVSVLDAEQSRTLQQALLAEGFGCEQAFGGTQCRLEKEMIDLDDNLVRTGEIHYFRGDGWVSTAYIDVLPEGYTQDIADTLWG